MADKDTKLSIVLGLVDKATAPLRAFNAQVARLSAPIRAIGERLRGIGQEAGLPQLVDGFKGVGGAVKDLLGKLLVVGGVAVGAVLGVKSLVDEFDDLGDKADRLGVHVDFLAQLRFAAERSGASVEQLDEGLQTFSVNLGAARANTGKMVKFLSTASPALLAQLKATKSTEEGFLLLADAIAAIKDPAKRLKLAAATVGEAALAPLLAQGSQGVAELMQQYFQLAGSQEAAAAGAGKVDDALKNAKAATEGAKAALLTGLSPALTIIVDKMTKWLVEHREDLARWAADIGDKLPGAIAKVVDWLGKAKDQVLAFVDRVGGLQNVALGLAAVIAGPLIGSILKLARVLLTNPIGLIVTAIATAAFLIIDNWEPITKFFSGLWDGVTAVFSKAWEIIKGIVDKVVGAVTTVKDAIGDFVKPQLGDFADRFRDPATLSRLANPFSDERLNAVAGVAARSTTNNAHVTLEIKGAPLGARATIAPQSTASIDLSVGHQLLGYLE